MHTIWNGVINFGLINIPVKLSSSSKDQELKFRMLHKKDHSPIRYARMCKKEEKEVPYEEIVKGYEYQKDDYVILSNSDFEKASVSATNSIDILQFAYEEEIDVRYFQKPYYLEPDKKSIKPYVLLAKALEESKKIAITKIVLHQREHLAVIKPIDSILVLDLMRFESEVLPPEISLSSVKISKKEMDTALLLIDQLTEDFNAKDFHDTYTEKLEKLIKAKAKGHTVHAVKIKTPKVTPVKDLLAMLKKSLAANQNHKHVKKRA